MQSKEKKRYGLNRSIRYEEEVARIHRTIKKKYLNDPDNHNGVITHLELDTLDWEIKWALGTITQTKLVEVMEFWLSYFKS